MRKIALTLSGLSLLALNWAALHDILKGGENVWMEGSFVIGSTLLFAIYLICKARQSV